MIRVEIQNFQSIAKQVVEINDFSVIVGRSNIGKSAVIRALKAAMTGSPVDAYVRHGEGCARISKGNKTCKCFCSVHIKTDGLDLLWQKGDSVNRYVYNGEEHTVAGRGTPEFLEELFSPVKLGSDKSKTLLQVSNQFNPIFILNESGPAVADILSDVAKLDQINEAARLAAKDRKEVKATRKVREKDVKDLKAQLQPYDHLDDVLGRVRDLASLEAEVAASQEKVDHLDRLMERAGTVARRIRQLEGVGTLRIPPIDPAVDLGEKVGWFSEAAEEYHSKSREVRKLEGVDEVYLPDIEVLRRGDTYDSLARWTRKVTALKDFFGKAKALGLAKLPDLEALDQPLTSYDRLQRWVSKLRGVKTVYGSVKESLVDVDKRVRTISAEFDALGVCPTCEQPIHATEHAEVVNG